MAEHQHLAGVDWEAAEKWHVTVCFVGNVPAEMVPNLTEMFRGASRRLGPFRLVPAQVRLAPPGEAPPRMVWLQFAEAEAGDAFGGWGSFGGTARYLAGCCRQVLPGHQSRQRPVPHLTLARLAPGADAGLGHLPMGVLLPALEVPVLVLWETVGTPAGPRYRALAELPLGLP